MEGINNVVTIPTSINGKFFRWWLEFLRPFHKLTDRELDVMSAFLKERYELSKVIKDNELLNKITMSEDTKRKIREDCNITTSHFQVIMTKLKKSKIIDNGRINPKFIPLIDEDAKDFKLLLYFDLQ
jgi:hypothetical protein